MNHRRAAAAIAGAAAVTLVVLAWRQAWVCDDALISFRYVRHLVAGDGLVFDLGERIEAFSSPLFVVLLAPAAIVHADLFTTAIVIGIVASACEVGVIVWKPDHARYITVRSIRSRRSRRPDRASRRTRGRRHRP